MANEKRLIDANKLNAVLQNITEHLAESGDVMLAATLLACQEAVKEQRTVDAVEVVHGRWIDREDGETVCSNCDTRIPEMYSNADTVLRRECCYCHKCGAKMDGGSKDV